MCPHRRPRRHPQAPRSLISSLVVAAVLPTPPDLRLRCFASSMAWPLRPPRRNLTASPPPRGRGSGRSASRRPNGRCSRMVRPLSSPSETSSRQRPGRSRRCNAAMPGLLHAAACPLRPPWRHPQRQAPQTLRSSPAPAAALPKPSDLRMRCFASSIAWPLQPRRNPTISPPPRGRDSGRWASHLPSGRCSWMAHPLSSPSETSSRQRLGRPRCCIAAMPGPLHAAMCPQRVPRRHSPRQAPRSLR
mmetsp:Transcript_8347/g.23960  ORF Transcript_8347/g.23960 Transcript_8347/m.23960 type:complete len:246 (-) Transcript_8347:67-804(-)